MNEKVRTFSMDQEQNTNDKKFKQNFYGDVFKLLNEKRSLEFEEIVDL